MQQQKQQQRAHITRFLSTIGEQERGESSPWSPLTLLGRTASPQEVSSRLQTAEAGEGRGILSSWPMQRCQVQKVADRCEEGLCRDEGSQLGSSGSAQSPVFLHGCLCVCVGEWVVVVVVLLQ